MLPVPEYLIIAVEMIEENISSKNSTNESLKQELIGLKAKLAHLEYAMTDYTFQQHYADFASRVIEIIRKDFEKMILMILTTLLSFSTRKDVNLM